MLVAHNNIWLARAIALLWGFLFVLLFRFSLNTLYPFWAGQFSLSFSALLLATVVFISFFWYFYHHQRRKRKGWVFSLMVTLNTAIFLTMIVLYPADQYLYLFPVFFSLQIIIHFFLFAAKLPFFIPYRLSLVAGIIPGILPLEIFQNPWFIFLLGAAISIFPNRLLYEQSLKLPASQVRMLPLRQSIDFLRFLFLGMATFGIFDIFRQNFYLVVSILVVSALLQYAMIRLDRRRHHIRQGMLLLGAIFIALGIGYAYLPFSIWAGIGYGALALWESLYFKKVVEGYLVREQIIVGATLAICLLAYFITYEWSILLFGIIGILLQFRIITYVFKRYRLLMGGVFVCSLLIWAFGVTLKYQDSFTRQFFNVQPTHTNLENPGLTWLLRLPAGFEVYTNAFAPEALADYRNTGRYFSKLEYRDISASQTTLWLMNHKEADKRIFLFDLDKLRPYRSGIGREKLKAWLTNQGIQHVIYFQSKAGNITFLTESNKITALNKKLTAEQKEFCRSLGLHLASFYTRELKYVSALATYRELLEIFKKDAGLFLQAARLAGSSNEGALQVEYLKKHIKLSDGPALEEKRLLMELYFNQGKMKDARKLAERLLDDDSENSYTYFKWQYKILLNYPKAVNWREFYRDVKKWRVKKTDVARYENKQKLLVKVREQVKRNPAWYQIQRETNQRQEKLVFPD